MLTKWGLKNFKSIKNAEIELAPLTILTGPNSSGKSSFLQSILLIAQTLRNTISERELVINGQFVQMGSLNEIKSEKSNDFDDVQISFSYQIDEQQGSKIEYTIGYNSTQINPLVAIIAHYQNKDGNIELEARRDNDTDKMKIVSIKLKKQDYNLKESFYDSIKSDGYKNIELNTEHFLPWNCLPQNIEDIENERLIKFVRESMKFFFKACENDFISFFPPHLLNAIISISSFFNMSSSSQNINDYSSFFYELKNKNKLDEYKNIVENIKDEEIIKLKKYFISLLGIIDEHELKNHLNKLNKSTSDYFSKNLYYIGPLRHLNPLYPISLASDPKNVGINGEYTAFVIKEYSNEKVNYYIPEDINDDSNNIFSKLENNCLSDALIFWLGYLEICNDIKIIDVDKIGYQITVIQENIEKHIEMTQVGAGVSQVLPILVMGLLAENDSTLIFQQPEEHLHPMVQFRLVDFFISMSLLGKQCIIETHSEYFIDKIRLRTCKSLLNNNDKIKKATKIYYLSKEEHGAEVTSIEIDKYATYTVWPDGFFDIRQIVNEEIRHTINRKALEEMNEDEESLSD